jgi:hypothetical protein
VLQRFRKTWGSPPEEIQTGKYYLNAEKASRVDHPAQFQKR